MSGAVVIGELAIAFIDLVLFLTPTEIITAQIQASDIKQRVQCNGNEAARVCSNNVPVPETKMRLISESWEISYQLTKLTASCST